MLKHLFQPASVAVVGASRHPKKLGHIILRNLIRGGYQGRIYPVNPEAQRILNLKCYPAITALPDKVDLAIFSISAPLVLGAIQEATRKDIPAGIIITAGFKETGPEGARLEKDIRALTRKHRLTLLGPNCIGLINTASHLNATFSITPKMPRPGNIAFFSQSGALSMGVLDWAIKEQIGLSKLVSLGNKIDIDEVSLLEYLARDNETRVILGYLEGIERGAEFMKIAARISRHKPILLVKGGTTERGARAVSSHTGSLAGREVAYQAAFHQSGVIRVNSLPELFDLAQAFIRTKSMQGLNLAIVTNSGGPAVLATDSIEKSCYLKMATFASHTIERLRANFPRGAAIYNPIDVIADAPEERYRFALKTVLSDKNVDGVLVIYTPATRELPARIARACIDIARHSAKPVFSTFLGGELVQVGTRLLKEADLPNYNSPDRAVAAFEVLYQHYQWSHRRREALRHFKVNKQAVARIIQDALVTQQLSIGNEAGLRILAAYGINTPQLRRAHNQTEAVALARKIGFPVVLKINSPDILHKTEVNGVRLDIRNQSEVVEAFNEMVMTARARMSQAEIKGVTIQPMVTGGKEVIIGMVRDLQFGPMIMFGLGGIYVEALKDVAFRVAPLFPSDAEAMVREIQGYRILAGMRGEAPSDLDTLRDTILKVAQLALDFPEVMELDINPFRVFEKGRGGIALDARISLKGEDWV